MYRWYADDQGAWLAVPLRHVAQLGLADRFGAGSHMDAERAYLEEDEHASVFERAAKAGGIRYQIDQEVVVAAPGTPSPVRELGPYAGWLASRPVEAGMPCSLKDGRDAIVLDMVEDRLGRAAVVETVDGRGVFRVPAGEISAYLDAPRPDHPELVRQARREGREIEAPEADEPKGPRLG